MSPLFWLNFIVLQWSGRRLARVIDDATGEQLRYAWVSVQPLTGWTFGDSIMNSKLDPLVRALKDKLNRDARRMAAQFAVFLLTVLVAVAFIIITYS